MTAGGGFKNFVRQCSQQKYQFFPSFSQEIAVVGSTDIPQIGSTSRPVGGASLMTVRTGKLNGGRASVTMTRLSKLTRFATPGWRLRWDHGWRKSQRSHWILTCFHRITEATIKILVYGYATTLRRSSQHKPSGTTPSRSFRRNPNLASCVTRLLYWPQENSSVEF